MNLTPKQIDLITNGMSALTGAATIGLAFGTIDFKVAMVIGFVSHVVVAFLTGKGIPSVKSVAAEIRNQQDLS